MNFETAIESLKEGYAVYHPCMREGAYFTYDKDFNNYKESGGPTIDFSMQDAEVFFERFSKAQFDSLWVIDLDRSPEELRR
jgi:hypothetical protein